MIQLQQSRSKLNKRIRESRPDAKRVVVIGNGMVGFRFCQRLAELDTDGHYKVTVFGEEPRPAYDRVNITDYFSGKSATDLELANFSWYDKRDIALRTGDPVVEIDREQKVVTSQSGQVIAYDTLVLATGATPFVPKIPGVDSPGVHVYRTIEDLDAIRLEAKSRDMAAVMGGGLLGLEAAKALLDLGLKPTVLQLSNSLLSKQLDYTSGSILRTHIEKAGIDVRISHQTTSIEQISGNQLLLNFADGKAPLITDMVVISAGIVPRDNLAISAGINHNRGIIVSDTLQTSDPDIYAIGECVRHRGHTYGLVAPGYEMADVVAARLAGEDAHFREGDETARLKVVGVNVAVMGRFNADAYTVSMNSQGKRKKLVISAGNLIGASVVGDWDELNQVQEAVEAEKSISSRQIQRFKEKGQIWRKPKTPTSPVDWPDTQTICNCMKISKGDLIDYQKEVAERDGSCSLETLMQCSRAGTVCGSCKPLVAEVMQVNTAHPLAASSLRISAPKGNTLFLIFSVFALALLGGFLAMGPLPYAESVQSTWYQIDQIWRDSEIRQWTGFGLLGVCVLGLIMSLRKRIRWFKWLDYGWYRLFHGAIGILSLIGIVVHTGMRMGENLNFVLMVVFLGLNVVGAGAGIVSSLEAKGGTALALKARKWRPVLTWLHILFFWPMPVLLVFHILSAYMY